MAGSTLVSSTFSFPPNFLFFSLASTLPLRVSVSRTCKPRDAVPGGSEEGALEEEGPAAEEAAREAGEDLLVGEAAELRVLRARQQQSHAIALRGEAPRIQDGLRIRGVMFGTACELPFGGSRGAGGQVDVEEGRYGGRGGEDERGEVTLVYYGHGY